MSARETRSGKYTKKWILETALKLFNEHGSQAISTKRIAKEMGISPGNLYYHFKNKDEIIRAILINSEDYDNNLKNERLSPLWEFLKSMNGILLSWQEYPFFKRELYTLLKNDPELKKWYNNIRGESLKKFEIFAREFIKTGSLHISISSLFTTIWLIAEHWINYLEIQDEPLSKKKLSAGIDLMIQVLRPYLNKKALNEVNGLAKSFNERGK